MDHLQLRTAFTASGDNTDSPGSFAMKLRTALFDTQAEAGRAFGIPRNTISKYETGAIRPRPGYYANLAKLLVDDMVLHAASVEQVDECRQFLLAQLQKYARLYETRQLFRTWEEVLRLAERYQHPAAQSATTLPTLPTLTGPTTLHGPEPQNEAFKASQGSRDGILADPGDTIDLSTTERINSVTVPGPTPPIAHSDTSGRSHKITLESTHRTRTKSLHGRQERIPSLLLAATCVAAVLVALGAALAIAGVISFGPAGMPSADDRNDISSSGAPSPTAGRLSGTAVISNTGATTPGAVEPSWWQGPLLEEMWLDSRQPLGSIGSYYVRGTVPISAGLEIGMAVSGTYSAWSSSWWSSVCKGSPEPEPQYYTEPGATTTYGLNGFVGLDAEYVFAAPDGSDAYCGRRDPPPYVSLTPLYISIDNGVTWIDPIPLDTAYSPEHRYSYVVPGRGFPLQARLVDYDPTNNYGRLHIALTTLDPLQGGK